MSVLRYSPVNWLIIDWAFPTCGLPRPQPCEPTPEPAAPACKGQPLVVLPNTYSWERWLPNVEEGLDDPDDDIAADRAREAAIDFAERSWVLQREIVIDLQPGVTSYPAIGFPDERIVGLIGAKLNDGQACGCSKQGGSVAGVTFNVTNTEIHVECAGQGGKLSLLVWAAPTEDACAHDVLLYDNYRSTIAAEARRRYAKSHYYKDRALMYSLPTEQAFEKTALNAKRRAVKPTTAEQYGQVSDLWKSQRPMGTTAYWRT